MKQPPSLAPCEWLSTTSTELSCTVHQAVDRGRIHSSFHLAPVGEGEIAEFDLGRVPSVGKARGRQRPSPTRQVVRSAKLVL